MSFAKHRKSLLNQQSDHPPLGTIYCLDIKPSKKENGSIRKGLERIQILIDTDKFHSMLLLKKGKKKAGESFEFPSGRMPWSFAGAEILSEVNYSRRASVGRHTRRPRAPRPSVPGGP